MDGEPQPAVRVVHGDSWKPSASMRVVRMGQRERPESEVRGRVGDTAESKLNGVDCLVGQLLRARAIGLGL